MASRLRSFLRRHLLWAGLLAAALPLACLLAVQYHNLRKLEESSVIAQKHKMRSYIDDVAKEVKYFYHTGVEQTLNLKASAVDISQAASSPFCRCRVVGAKFLFVTLFDGSGGMHSAFYEPAAGTRIENASTSDVEAAQAVAALYRTVGGQNTALNLTMIYYDGRDPEHRILYKLILDDRSKVAGVAGLVIDEAYFRDAVLPRTIRETLQKYYAEHRRDNVIVAVYDDRGAQAFASQEGGEQVQEMTGYLPFFYNWRVDVKSRDRSLEQLSRWSFNLNFGLLALTTAALLGGVALALRSASREMRLSQMKADFVSNVSHELRTPLASIRVFGEFFKHGRVRDESKVREYGAYIEAESRRLTQLINNILDFSKIESNRRTYKFLTDDAAAIVCDTLQTLEVQLRQQGFNVTLEQPPAPLPPVWVDAEAIAQALLNLLDNAVKYSGASREIRVGLARRDGFVTVTVTDCGVGVAAEEQKKIFEKFYRVCTGLVHDVKGSGLGLALVAHIMEAHGGRVTVESRPGRGSAFTLHLPVAVTDGARVRAGNRAGEDRRVAV